jgi:hypothetical protein
VPPPAGGGRGREHADLGVLGGRLGGQRAAQRGARPFGITVDQQPHQVGDVVVRTRQPVLQGEEIGPHVLRGARHEAQDARQHAQHLELLRAGRLAGAAARLAVGALAAQALEQRQRSAGRLAHVEAAHAGEPGHFRRRHAAHHGVAGVAPRLQRRQHGLDVVVHEHHRHEHDVGLRDVGLAALQRGRLIPLGRRVQRQAQPRQLAQQHVLGALGRAGQMAVQRHDGDAQRHVAGAVSGRSALWLHRVFQP